jgi:hypothetical protein
LDAYGREKIEFCELAVIWENNKYDVIIEPAGLMMYEMMTHWPNTKFIHMTRDPEQWKTSFTYVII